MVRIAVGDSWVITSDSLQFILNKKKVALSGEKKGQEYLEAVGYYSKIEQLVGGLIHFDIRASKVKAISELASSIESIGKLCQEAFSKNNSGLK
ncbi:DUF5405 family protein [Rahnella aceris]|nr:hypothetical protein SRABI106_01732 [Rahnella aquatilis]